ncbi:MAG: hypothetical protein ACK6DZ_25100 [Acidobacteriota bacterium]
MKPIREHAGTIRVGRFSFRLERTLRVPDDGHEHPLPPTFGAFPIYAFAAYSKQLSAAWRGRARYFIPIRQWEALWISFDAPAWRPNAVQIFAGGMNVLTGDSSRRLQGRPQNYIVCPEQPWLDGFKTSQGCVRQFVAAPLDQGLTVAEQLGCQSNSLVSIRVIEAQPGRFPSRPPCGFRSPYTLESITMHFSDLGLGAGGIIQQKIYPDPYGLRTWNSSDSTTIDIALLNSEAFCEITGQQPPPSTISAIDYTRLGFPWFQLYDEDALDTKAARRMRGIESLKIPDPSTGAPVIRKLRRPKTRKDKNA